MIGLLGILVGIASIGMAVFLGMLGDAPLARYAVVRSLRKLPKSCRPRYREEWEADLVVLQNQPMRLLLWTWGLTASSRALASALDQSDTTKEVGAGSLPPAIKLQPDTFGLRGQLKSLGISDERLRQALVERGVHKLRQYDQIGLWDRTLGRRKLGYFWLDANKRLVGELVVVVTRSGVGSFSIWNLDNEPICTHSTAGPASTASGRANVIDTSALPANSSPRFFRRQP